MSKRPAVSIGNDETQPYAIDFKKAAIIIIDMQTYQTRDSVLTDHVEIIFPGFKSYIRKRIDDALLPNMNRLIELARAKGMRVVATRYVSLEEDGSDLPKPCQEINRFSLESVGRLMIPKKGDEGAELIDGINLVNEDLVVDKNGSSVFTGNNLHQIFRSEGIDHLILTGVLTNCCVSSSAREAWDSGYYVTVISDACAGSSQYWHDTELENLGFVYTRNLSCESFFSHIDAS